MTTYGMFAGADVLVHDSDFTNTDDPAGFVAALNLTDQTDIDEANLLLARLDALPVDGEDRCRVVQLGSAEDPGILVARRRD